MIRHRGITVTTSFSFGRGEGGGAAISHVLTLFFFSQNYTEEQISQRCTETLSQPMTQSVTANISYKVCDICRLLAGVCGFSLFAERFLFICEDL